MRIAPLIRVALAALVAVLVPALQGCGDDSGGGTRPPGCYSLADGRCVEETFRNPPVLQPNADGVYELELRPTEVTFGGQRHCTRAYNGLYPAPTIDTPAAGDGGARRIRIDLRNGFTRPDNRRLSADPCECMDPTTSESCIPDHHELIGQPCECTTPAGNECHIYDFNVTNLHAHGSHVRPDYASGGGCVERDGLRCRACTSDPEGGPRECYFADDVISRVEVGEGIQVRWDIDEDHEHAAGMHWYHPHIHGSTAIQVASGATGAWIIRGPIDTVPGIANARERVIVFTTPPIGYTPLADGEPCDEDHITFQDFHILAETEEKQTNLINGLRRPRMVMPPGQIERWRFLHGAFLDEVFLTLMHGNDSDCESIDVSRPPVAMTQIERDGIPLPRPPDGAGWPYAPDYIFMSPGYRVETLLDGGALSHGDTLCLVALRFLQEDTTGRTGGEAVGITAPPTPESLLRAASNADVVAIVNVTNAAGTPTETNMPDLAAVAEHAPSLLLQNGAVDALERCAEMRADDPITEIDQMSALWMLFFMSTEGDDTCSCPDHNINCGRFEHTDRSRYPYDRVFRLGSVERWRVVSGFDGHPFHIHINPFLVCPLPPEGSDDPNVLSRIFEPPFAHWRDTYLVNLTRRLDMLTEYRAFAGSYVFHCHKLNHEDHGMMELVHVCDPATEACDELCDGHACGWRECSDGDDDCLRALAATDCTLDPSRCADAAVRCMPCDSPTGCPAGSSCRDDADRDGINRCAPGCYVADDCPPTDTCSGGECVPAPCMPPCPPPMMCTHGTCG